MVDSAAYFKAIAARHDGIGGGRIKSDYDSHCHDLLAILITFGIIQSPERFQNEAELFLRPLIDYGARSKRAEIGRCQEYGIQRQGRQSQSTAARAVRKVNWAICSTLWSLMYGEDVSLTLALPMGRALRKFLSWNKWKNRKGCGPDALCFAPIWSLGSAEDFENPR
ncbi:hypothetical protein F5Y16DRAFT_401683 [Xylariaceae sp. FL0255]|nr:hypothetical protein F5Y16DRAFT_401683 [Xylariaceae sp. FL0255]